MSVTGGPDCDPRDDSQDDISDQPTIPLPFLRLLGVGLTFAQMFELDALRAAYEAGEYVPSEVRRREAWLAWLRWAYRLGRLSEWPREDDDGGNGSTGESERVA